VGLERLLAGRTQNMASNAIREILKVVSQPGMVSLAGGIPAPESFPLERIERLAENVLRSYGSQALQYDLTEGFVPLREALVDYLVRVNVEASAEKVITTSGSQGALDALGKVLISPGDRVAVEAPTYLGAISAFNPYQPDYVLLETDDEGVIPGSLERCLAEERVAFVYLVPTFQNPSGRTLTKDRRREVAEIISRHDALLIEDDPYHELRYRGERLPAVHSWAPDNVVYLGTFSKILAPGFRVGFAVAPEPIRYWLVVAKQGTDLHTSTFSQALCAEYLRSGDLDRHLPEIRELYRPRRDAMITAMQQSFPEWMRWSDPDGGMFIWAESDLKLDFRKVYDQAVSQGVAFVPGTYFYAHDGEGLATMRLNFTMSDPDELRAAVGTLGEVLVQAGRASVPR
jgi:2-aminoadipate transaminase